MKYFSFFDINGADDVELYMYIFMSVYTTLFILSFYSFIRFYRLLRCMAVRVMATGLIALFSFTRVAEYVMMVMVMMFILRYYLYGILKWDTQTSDIFTFKHLSMYLCRYFHTSN